MKNGMTVNELYRVLAILGRAFVIFLEPIVFVLSEMIDKWKSLEKRTEKKDNEFRNRYFSRIKNDIVYERLIFRLSVLAISIPCIIAFYYLFN